MSDSKSAVSTGGPSADVHVTMAELLASLSFALDVTEGATAGHSLRACLLGMRIGQEIGLPDHLLADLYRALMLKDIGCSSNAARMADAFAADDQAVKHNFKLIDREQLGRPTREALTFVWDNIAPTESMWGRLRQMYQMIRSPGDLTAEVIETRCERGAVILHKLGMGIETCAAVYSLDEHWNGRGLPDHLIKQDIPLLGRICAVAQHLDIFWSESGADVAVNKLVERSGSWYDPDLVSAVQRMHARNALWPTPLQMSEPQALQNAVLAMDTQSSETLADQAIDLICSGFADVIDAKSPFTYRHSVATAEIAVLTGMAMGLSPDRINLVRRAALLHDIGMLGCPNTLLDKPGPLSREQWETVRRHPLLGREILSRVHAFREISDLVAEHHERLDGSGYPGQLHGDQLSLESRLLAVSDVLSALLEHRSYRHDLTIAEVVQELERLIPDQLDGACVEAAFTVLNKLAELPLSDIPAVDLGGTSELVETEEVPPLRFAMNLREPS